jgi:hypothetical protein
MDSRLRGNDEAHFSKDYKLNVNTTEGQDLLNSPSRFDAILFSSRPQVAGLVALSQGLPTQEWTKLVKS